MAYRRCPKCRCKARLLVTASEYAQVDYYRCGTCGHVWHYKKDDPKARPRDVTISETEDRD